MVKTGLIYIATSPSGKQYIGKTVQPMDVRKRKHATDAKRHDYAFANAINKYGIDGIKWDVLEENIPVESLSEKEVFYIQKFNTYKEGYNATEGGDFNPMDYEENRIKVSERTRGRRPTVDQSGEKNNQAKLKSKNVNRIRDIYAEGKHTMREIGYMFGVSRRNIQAIVSNTNWHNPDYIPPETNKSQKYTYNDELKIINDYKTGKYSSTSLAEKYSISFQSVCYLLNKHEDEDIIRIRNNNKLGQKLYEEDVIDAINKINNGELIKDLAPQYGVSVGTLSRRINKRRKTKNK